MYPPMDAAKILEPASSIRPRLARRKNLRIKFLQKTVKDSRSESYTQISHLKTPKCRVHHALQRQKIWIQVYSCFDWVFTCTQKYRMLEFKTRWARFSILIRGSNGYAGRDPQRGTSDGSAFSKNYFLLVIKRKIEIIFKVRLGRRRKLRRWKSDNYNEMGKKEFEGEVLVT